MKTNPRLFYVSLATLLSVSAASAFSQIEVIRDPIGGDIGVVPVDPTYPVDPDVGIIDDNTVDLTVDDGGVINIDDSSTGVTSAASAAAVGNKYMEVFHSGTTLLIPGQGPKQFKLNHGESSVHSAQGTMSSGMSANNWQVWYYRDRFFNDYSPAFRSERANRDDLGTIYSQNWGSGGGPSAIGGKPDNFGLYILKSMNFQQGCYKVSATSDDGSALYINNALILDNWGDHGPQTKSVYLQVYNSGSRLFQALYYENGGGAMVQIDRTYLGYGSCQNYINPPIPPVIPNPPSYGAWTAEFFNWSNQSSLFPPYSIGSGHPNYLKMPSPDSVYRPEYQIQGSPIRLDSISFDSDSGVPFYFSNMSSMYWAARYTRTENFNGCYYFNMTLDDGARVWVDGTLVIDDWREYSSRTITNNALGGRCVALWGSHQVRVEFIQKTGRATLNLNWNQTSEPNPNPGYNATVVLTSFAAYQDWRPCWATIDQWVGGNYPYNGTWQMIRGNNSGGEWTHFTEGSTTFTAHITLLNYQTKIRVRAGKGGAENGSRDFDITAGQTLYVNDVGCL